MDSAILNAMSGLDALKLHDYKVSNPCDLKQNIAKQLVCGYVQNTLSGETMRVIPFAAQYYVNDAGKAYVNDLTSHGLLQTPYIR